MEKRGMLSLAMGFHIGSLVLLWFSVFNDTPWYRISLSKAAVQIESPFVFSIGGIYSPPLISSLPSSEKASSSAISVEKSYMREEDTIVLTKWTLRNVLIEISGPLEVTRVIPFDEPLPNDAFVTMALSYAGVYEAVLDIKSVNKLLIGLTYWTYYMISLGILILVLILLYGACASNQIVRYNSWEIGNPLQELTVPLEGTRLIQRHSNSKSQFWTTTTGIVSIIGAVSLSIGFFIWASRSVSDSQIIFKAIIAIAGHRAGQWLTSHVVINFSRGLFQYMAAIVLTFTSALLCLTADKTVSSNQTLSAQQH